MSEFNVEVVEVQRVNKHPNADTLSIAYVNGDYPVVFKSETFKEGDKAVYIPIDALVPLTDQRFSFLSETLGKERSRIKAKRLRGIFSMGMLISAEPAWQLGQNVQDELNIKKWEPTLRGYNLNAYSEQTQDPGVIPIYTDLDSIRKYGDRLQENEEVLITEKLHGANARFVHDGEGFYVGPHRTFLKRDSRNMWWSVAEKYDLERKLAEHPRIGLYGEVYGQVQDLTYGAPNKILFAAFDAFDATKGRYLDVDDFLEFAEKLEIPVVPSMYRGPWFSSLRDLAEGTSTLADHVREGIVVRPTVERFDDHIGRIIFKLVGQQFLLRKDA